MKKAAALLLGLSLAPMVSAEGDEYISVFVDYLAKPDSSHAPELKDGLGFDLRYGKFEDESWGYEIRGFYGTLVPKAGGNEGFHSGLAGNATYRFGEILTVTPYLVLGGILAYSDLATDTLKDPRAGLMFDGGAGVWTRPFLDVFGRPLSARAEVRADLEFYDERYLDYRAYLGLSLPISVKAEPAPEPVKVVEVESQSSAEAVPEPVVVAEAPPPTPIEAPCKTPAPGEKVSLKGCGTGDTLVLRGVTFDFDKATLTANAKVLLDDVVAELKKYPDIKVEVGGHTDSKGSEAYNQRLSDTRAASVVSYLESQGILADRMSSVGYGEAQPVDDNESEFGREKNRRVELKIVDGTAVEPQAAAEPQPEAAPAEAPAAVEPEPAVSP